MVPAYIKAYAVLRVDHYLAPAAPWEYKGVLAAGPGNVKVKEVLMDAEEARREVVRLNQLNAEKDCTYYWQSCRLYLDGGSDGSRSSDETASGD